MTLTACAVEDYPSGYPQISALVGAHPSLHVFRRFTRLRARLILQKQDRLCLLEQELDELDRTEPKRLFLGSLRSDRNTTRNKLCDAIDMAMKDYGETPRPLCSQSAGSRDHPNIIAINWNCPFAYTGATADDFLDRAEKMLARASPRGRDVQSLQNWTQNTSSVSLEETKYLWEDTDLFNLGGLGRDEIVKTVEGPLEDAVFWCRGWTKPVSVLAVAVFPFPREPVTGSNLSIQSLPMVSRDADIHLVNRYAIEAFTQFLLACILVIILLGPIVTLATLHSFSARVSVLIASCVIFVASLLLLVKTKPAETFMASVAYVPF